MTGPDIDSALTGPLAEARDRAELAAAILGTVTPTDRALAGWGGWHNAGYQQLHAMRDRALRAAHERRTGQHAG